MFDYILPLIAYLFGSLSSAIIVSRIMRLPDPREAGSHNPGATNVLRLGGKIPAAITLAGDVSKGVVPMLLARAIGGDEMLSATVALAAFLGHLYPVFFRFRGGKGVATAAGVFLALHPGLFACLLAIWLAFALSFRYASLAAMAAVAAAPWLGFYFLSNQALQWAVLIIAAMLFWRHRWNFARLREGRESKIRF